MLSQDSFYILMYENRSGRDRVISLLGGFYHETTVAYFPSSETWMTQYVVSYSDDNINYQFYPEPIQSRWGKNVCRK